MNKKELLEFQEGLKAVSNLKGVKFAYAVSKNFNKIQPEIKSITDAGKPAEEFVKYDKERILLCEKFCKRNAEGNPVIVSGGYQMEDKEGFDKKLEALKKKHKKANDAREKQVESYEKFLEEEVVIEIHKVKIEDLPEDLTATQIDSIKEMIED